MSNDVGCQSQVLKSPKPVQKRDPTKSHSCHSRGNPAGGDSPGRQGGLEDQHVSQVKTWGD